MQHFYIIYSFVWTLFTFLDTKMFTQAPVCSALSKFRHDAPFLVKQSASWFSLSIHFTSEIFSVEAILLYSLFLFLVFSLPLAFLTEWHLWENTSQSDTQLVSSLLLCNFLTSTPCKVKPSTTRYLWHRPLLASLQRMCFLLLFWFFLIARLMVKNIRYIQRAQ